MKIDWPFNTQTLLDQLPSSARRKLLDRLAQLQDPAPDASPPPDLKFVGKDSSGSIYSFRVLPDWRLAIRRTASGFTVMDVARSDQMGFLRDSTKRDHALQE